MTPDQIRGEAPPRPPISMLRFRRRVASVSSCEKMTLSVKRSGAHRRNIENEGTGVAICRLPRNLSGVIFFASTGVRFLVFAKTKPWCFVLVAVGQRCRRGSSTTAFGGSFLNRAGEQRQGLSSPRDDSPCRPVSSPSCRP